METSLKKIFIIEDEMPMARPLKLKLEKSGFEVKLALNGEEALEILSKENFDFIILDLVIPKINGFRILSEMKIKGINIPIIVLSNLSQLEDIKTAKELGARDYFVKSNVTVANVVEYVKNFFS